MCAQFLVVECCFTDYILCLAKKLSKLIGLPLTVEEDMALCSYLEENPALTCQELLVMFHVQRSRYVEAIRVNRQLNERQRTLHDPQVWERSERRNNIINGIARSLPSCLKNLAQTFPTTIPPHHPSQQESTYEILLHRILHVISFNRSTTANVDGGSA